MLHGVAPFWDVPDIWIGCYREGSFSEAGQVLDPEFLSENEIGEAGKQLLTNSSKQP